MGKPLFQARHYNRIAAVIANADRHDCGDIIGAGLAADIAAMLAEDNPNFDRARFEEAAGLVEDT